MLIKLLSGVVIAYIAVLAMLYVLQTRLLFPASMASAETPSPPRYSTELEFVTPDGVSLKGILIEAKDSTDPEKPYILGFGGNAWNAITMAAYLHGLFPDHSVVVFHYRGYAPSMGQPSAESLLADSLLIFDYLHDHLGPNNFVGVGFSIGSGIAAHLASERPLKGLILVSPFDSLNSLASEHYPWLPVRWLLRHQMEPAQDLGSVTFPTAVIAAEKDSIIPPDRTEAVRQTVKNNVLDRTIEGADHNDLYDRKEFRSTIREALKRIEEEPDN